MHGAVAMRHRQTVIGLGEMVDADFLEPGGHEQIARGVVEFQTAFRRRQRLGWNQLLAFRHPRHMGVAKQRDPVGAKADDLVHRVGDPRLGLVRQPVEQIDVERCNLALAQHIDRSAGDLVALRPTDHFLDHRIEILHPDRGTVEPGRGERIEARPVHLGRVDLDGELGARCQRRDIEDRPGKIADHLGLQQRRRAAAEMQVLDLDSLGKMRLDQRQLLLERFDIGRDRLGGLGALGAAGAEPAQPAAERHVNVERHGATGGNRFQPVGDRSRPRAGLELRRGGIARIAGHSGVKQSEFAKLRV